MALLAAQNVGCDQGSGEARPGADTEAHRGPKWLATQPTIGAPIGVPPSAMPTRRAITLPRIAVSVESCMMLFVPLVKVRPAAPI